MKLQQIITEKLSGAAIKGMREDLESFIPICAFLCCGHCIRSICPLVLLLTQETPPWTVVISYQAYYKLNQLQLLQSR